MAVSVQKLSDENQKPTAYASKKNWDKID